MVQGSKSKYVDYDSNEALILPGHQRAAVLQGICLRNVIQNLTTVTGQKILAAFNTFKCHHLTSLGRKGIVAGIPRRPGLPNASKTMEYVTDYLSKLQGIALNEPFLLKDLQPALQFDRLHEISAAERHNRYAAFMKFKGRWIKLLMGMTLVRCNA